MQVLKCLVVGDHGVGKTSMLITHRTNTFPTEYIPPVLDQFPLELTVNENEKIRLDVWEKPPLDDSEMTRSMPYLDTDVFLVCFSINSIDSLESVQTKWIPQIQHYWPIAPVILVGTKADLRKCDPSSTDADSNEKLIEIEYVLKLAKELGVTEYLECSALTQDGLKIVFERGAQAAWDNRQKKAVNNKEKKNECGLL
jgi:small GTP-binding protein